MTLFRYMDALRRIEEARRGPRGLLDDEWFATFASPSGGLPPAGEDGAVPFAPTHGPDPFKDWYETQLRQALRETFTRLADQYPAMPLLGHGAMPGWLAEPDDRAWIARGAGESLRGDRSPYAPPWHGRDSSGTGGVVHSSNLPPTPESLRGAPDSKSSTSPEKPFRQLPNPSVDERDLARGELKHRAIIDIWRESGRNTSADHLERFLDGDGSTLVIGRDDARSFAPIRNAEQKNERRLERSLLIGGKRAHAERLANLQDGKTIQINDNFKVDYGPGSFLLQALDPSTTDFATAFGRLGFKSEGSLMATRRGDTIEIEGIVSHGFDDRYDFNPGQPYSSEPNLLERKGNARSYDRTSSWKRRLIGSIKLDNGRLHSPRFTWEDIDP